jgi:catechol 2,3-dioxygenase-like lactoylglutathione lyase family enzyme
MRLSAILMLGAAIGAVSAGRVDAQTKTLPYDHIHLNVPDAAAASAWYEKNIPGARRITEMPDRLMYGSTRLMFLVTKNPVEPSTGSAVDHLGFSVKDLDATLKTMEAAGVKITSPARDLPGIFKIAFIEDPWGTRIELVQDAELLGLHHIHMRGPDVEEAFKWLLGNFGGERARMKDKLDGVRYSAPGFSTVWILMQKGDATPTQGKAIDHIGWRSETNLTETINGLKAKGVTVTSEPRPLELKNGPPINFAYVAGPNGARIELVERPGLKPGQ